MYKIKDNILWRNEKNSLMILHPISKKLMIYGKNISDSVSKNGLINDEFIENKNFISFLLDQLIIEESNVDLQQPYGSDISISAPLNVTIQLTNRCNLKCGHCHRVDKGSIDLSKECLFSLVDEFYSMKVFNINISGGEPLLYSGIYELIEYIISKGMKVTMSTNLVLWNQEIAQKIFDLGLKQVHVSLDSSDEKYHNHIRGFDNSYSMTIKNLEILRKIGIEFTLVTTLVNQTFEDYGNTIDLAYRLGSSGHKTNILVPQGQGKTLEVGYYKDFSLFKGYISIYSEKRKLYDKKMPVISETMFSISIGENNLNKPEILQLQCPAGVLTCAITEKGEVLPCPFYSEISIGNIYESSFKDIWKNSQLVNKIRISKLYDNSGCQARAYSVNQNIIGEDPYLYKRVYNLDSHEFYNTSAQTRNKFISKIGHGIEIKGEKGNKEFYGLVHNYLLNSDLTLELGTGTGIVPKTLGKLGKKIISVDFSENMLRLAKDNCKDFKNIRFKKENINNLSFDDQTFDLVIKRLAPDNVQQVYRVLKDGGNFINFTNGERDGIELKEIFGFSLHESVEEHKSKLLKNKFQIIYEEDFAFKEIYNDFEILINMLHIAPIIPDFLERKSYYIDYLNTIFDKVKGFTLTRHKYLVNVKK